MSGKIALPLKVRELTGSDHRGMGWVVDADGHDIVCYGAMELWEHQNRDIGDFIVRACNCHDELLEALQRLINVVTHPYTTKKDCRIIAEDARAVIAKV